MKYKLKFLFALFLIFSACTEAPRHSGRLLRPSLLHHSTFEAKFAFMTSVFPTILAPPIIVCSVNNITGELTECKSAGATNTNQPYAISIVEIDHNNYAYTANKPSGTILKCSINGTTGLFSNCMNAISTTFSNVQALAFHNANNGELYAYLNSELTSSPFTTMILKCSINTTTGQFSQCVDSGVGASFSDIVTAIAFDETGAYAYVTSNAGIKFCSVDNTGSLSNCNSIGPLISYAVSLAFTTENGQTYAFLGTGSNFINQCDVNTNGTFSNCTALNLFNANSQINGIAFQTIYDQKYAYIADLNNGVIWQCKFSPQNSTLQNCTKLQSTTTDSPGYYGIGFPYQAGI